MLKELLYSGFIIFGTTPTLNAPSTSRADVFSLSTDTGSILNGGNDYIQFYPLMARGVNDSGVVDFTASFTKSIELASDGTLLSPQLDLAFGYSSYVEDQDYSHLYFLTDLSTFTLGGSINSNNTNTGRLDMSNFYFEFYSFFELYYQIDGRALGLNVPYSNNIFVTLNITSFSIENENYYYNNDGSVSLIFTHTTLYADLIYFIGSLHPNVTSQDVLVARFETIPSCAFRAVWGDNDGSYLYDLGYNTGYSSGLNTSNQDAYNKGFNDARDQFENTSFADMFFTIMDTPFKVIEDAFNLDFFGINLASLIVGIFSIMLVIWLLKFFRGG